MRELSLFRCNRAGERRYRVLWFEWHPGKGLVKPPLLRDGKTEAQMEKGMASWSLGPLAAS